MLSGEDSVRKEKLTRARRDYNLMLFQQKENELGERVIELQDMLEVERGERERGDQGYEELREKYVGVLGKYGKLKGKFTTLLAKAKSPEMHRNLQKSGSNRRASLNAAFCLGAHKRAFIRMMFHGSRKRSRTSKQRRPH